MSGTSLTLDVNSPLSATNTSNVPRSSGLSTSGTIITSRQPSSSTSNNQNPNQSQDLSLVSLNTSPSPYITVTNVTTAGGIVKNEASLEYPTQVELSVQSHYSQQQQQQQSPLQQQQQQPQYCRLGGGGVGGGIILPSNNNSNSTNNPPNSLQDISRVGGSIVVPVTTQDVDPFVVTVRNSPNKLGKSNSSSFMSKSLTGSNSGVSSSSSKTGPRLALYRSNSSLDLLDRENYYHHQRASLGGGKLSSHHVHPHHQHPHNLHQQLDHRQTLLQQKNQQAQKGEVTYTGCFTRRKDFGSHGSIDVLSNAGGNNSGVGNNNSATSSSNNNTSVKNERSSSLGNNSTGHFLSLVASSMSRDRRGSFDVNDGDGISSGSSNNTKNVKSGSGSGNSESSVRETASPRLRLKFQKLWEHKEKPSQSTTGGGGGQFNSGGTGAGNTTPTDGSGKSIVSSINTSKTEASIFRKLRGSSTTSRNNGNTKSLPEGVKFDVLSGVNQSGDHNMETQGAESNSSKAILRQGGGGGGGSGSGSVGIEERFRRRVFAHYDCQSVSANISYAARLRGLLSKRRNTTTGASAASLGHRPLSTPPSASLNNIAGAPGGRALSLSNNENPSLDLVPADDPDLGDGNSNALILSCPYFRNEIGGEEERVVCLTRFKSNKLMNVIRNNYHHLTSSGSNIGQRSSGDGSASLSLGRGGSSTLGHGARINLLSQSPLNGSFHRSQEARGLSLLEWSPGTTHWTQGTCPYTNKSSTRQSALEAVDLGAAYYRRYFYRQDHENWFGSDEILGPLAISIKRERIENVSTPNNETTITSSHNNNKDHSNNSTVLRSMYRLIVRSTELNTLRGAIAEDSIPGIKLNSNKGGCHAKEVIEFLLPEIQLSCLKLGLQTLPTEDQLLKLDQQILTHRHKVGIMYCKAGQATEEEMYNNEEAGPAFNEFLDLIGQRVRLKGFDKYTGGLDNKDDSTGLNSIYSQYQDCEVIFHVSTLLPFTANNRQQLMRKRHIGNDIVTIVFQEPGALPFTPKNIRSQFQHVFIIVRALNPCSENTGYSVSVSRSKEVPLFGPAIPEGAKFQKNNEFVDFLLAKVINAENATYRSEKFTTMATRTRQEYLKDLVSSYSSNTSIDPRPKFSMLAFGNKKKELVRPRFNSDPGLHGALSWAVYLDDNSLDSRLDAYLALSVDSLVIIDAVSREPVFAVPCSSILGWNTSMCNSLRIYYHQGECVTLHSKEPGNFGVGENDDLMEIVGRLEAVTEGCETQEFILRRNELGQLGFHVQQDGVVTEVEPCGYAAKAGLKQGSRLVEICKVAVATLNQEQMIDFLKTSNTVIVMVVPSLPDGSPRRGCDAKRCIYTLDMEGEYENLNLNGPTDDECPSSIIHHQFKTPNSNSLLQPAVPGNHRKRYEPRSFSPPRSSNSSGYGTGSSSKSFSSASEPHFPPNPHEGETLTSSSSGMSSTDERWYDLTENLDGTNESCNDSPPPIPARNVNAPNNTTSIIVTQAQQQHQQQQPQSMSLGTPVSRPTTNGNSLSNNSNNINIVGKGSGTGAGAGAGQTTPQTQSFQNQNGTSNVVVVNNGSSNTNLNNNHKNNNNNPNTNGTAALLNGNGNGRLSHSTQNGGQTGGIYMTPPLDKSFVAKKEFFQRNNPHHGSFHTKLSPSRSHDLLHLKSTYGIHHSQLKPFPSSTVGGLGYGLDDYGGGGGDGSGAVAISSHNGNLTRYHHRSNLIGVGDGVGGGGGSVYQQVNPSQIQNQNQSQHQGSNNIFNSPLIENTVKGKVTYLTDFPLTHSHSTEHLVGYSNYNCNGNGHGSSNYHSNNESLSHKELVAMKNERLALLKSTYLEKHRERQFERDNESNKSRFSAPADSISGEINGSSEDDLSLMSTVMKPRSASNPVHGRTSTNSSPNSKISLSHQNGNGNGEQVKMRQPLNNNSSISTPRQNQTSNNNSSNNNRNSTLQEDLIRLIAPDLIPTKDVDDHNNQNHRGSPLERSPGPGQQQQGGGGGGQRPSSSGSVPIITSNAYVSLKARPVSCGGEPGLMSTNYSSGGNSANGKILSSAHIVGVGGTRNGGLIPQDRDRLYHERGTVARKAVPAEKEGQFQEEDVKGKVSTTTTTVTVPLPLLPDSGDMDWSTLVDTATKAFQCCDIDVAGENGVMSMNGSSMSTTVTSPLKLSVNQSTNSPLHQPLTIGLLSSSSSNSNNNNNVSPSSSSNISSTCSSTSPHSMLPWIDELKSDDPGVPVESVFNLEARVSQLEAELRKEQHSKHVLAAKVANLQQENRLLQEQTHSTQHQFKKFAEWLRHTGLPDQQQGQSPSRDKTKPK